AIISLFFFLPRHPPRSPLFPYTTLFRSAGGETAARVAGRAAGGLPAQAIAARLENTASRSRIFIDSSSRGLSDGLYRYGPARKRSEEHTSELQSLAYLVCRLLLEKKKKT